MGQNTNLSLQEAGQRLNVKPSVLRYFCNKGFIPSVRRNRRGYRVLNASQLDLAKILINMKQTGFTSAEIRQYSRLYRQGESTLAERTAILTTRKRQLWQEITDRQKASDCIERQEEQLETKTSAL